MWRIFVPLGIIFLVICRSTVEGIILFRTLNSYAVLYAVEGDGKLKSLGMTVSSLVFEGEELM